MTELKDIQNSTSENGSMNYKTLQEILDQRKNITVDELNLDDNILAAIELQTRLCDLGILDPIVDGDINKPFGPVAKADGIIGVNSRAALREFCRLLDIPYIDRLLTPQVLHALLHVQAETFLPIEWENKQEDDLYTRLSKRVLRYMRDQGYWIARSPEMYNIVYVEGMNADGRENADTFDHWNDRRLVIRILPGGKPQMLVNDQSTTEPGKYYTTYPLHKYGAARIAFGQYKAWAIGLHQGWQPALVQRKNVKVHRDLDKNGARSPKDIIDIGSTFGINHHSTHPNYIPYLVGKYSAGCLVGRRYYWHMLFLNTIKKDIRYLHNRSYLFMTAVLPGDDLVRNQPH
ncbi:MAG: hypothetical protein R2792_08545 [Saprospiraceae bacterium]